MTTTSTLMAIGVRRGESAAKVRLHCRSSSRPPTMTVASLQGEQRCPIRNATTPSSSAAVKAASISPGIWRRRARRSPWSNAAGSAAPVPTSTACPSKNEIWSAGVASIVARAGEFGVTTGPVSVDMKQVLQRKRDMVDGLVAFHLERYEASGAELIMGTARLVAPRTVEVALNDGGTRRLVGREALPQPRHAREHPFRPGSRRGAAAHQHRGARARPGSRPSDRARRRLCRPRVRPGLPALRQSGHHRRAWSAAGQARGPGCLRRGSAHSGGGRHRGAAVRGGRARRGAVGRGSARVVLRTADGQRHGRGHRHPGRRRPHAQHARHRPRRGRDRADRSRLHPCQRSARDDGPEHLGDRRVRGKPAVHPHVARRLSRDPGQPGGRQPDDRRAG